MMGTTSPQATKTALPSRFVVRTERDLVWVRQAVRTHARQGMFPPLHQARISATVGTAGRGLLKLHPAIVMTLELVTNTLQPYFMLICESLTPPTYDETEAATALELPTLTALADTTVLNLTADTLSLRLGIRLTP